MRHADDAIAVKVRGEAVLRFSDGLPLGAAERIAQSATEVGIPCGEDRAPIAQRCNLVDLGRKSVEAYPRRARYVDRNYQGVELAPTLNSAIAKAIGLNFTQSQLLRADEMIQ